MKIVIGMPIHNCSGFTKYIIEDFMDHNTSEHTITFVIVDNGSTDDSKSFCENLEGVHPKIASNVNFVYERFEDNPGCSKSFNKVYEYFDREKADLCILINNDIVLSKDWLSQLVEFHNKNLEVGIFSPHLIDNHVSPETVKEWFGDVRNNQSKNPSPEWQKYVDNVLASEKNIRDVGMQGPMLVITRECRDAVGNWDENFIKGCYDDCDYQYRARNLGFFSYVTHNCVIFHFGGSTQWYVTTHEGGNGYQEQNKQYFQKKWKVNLAGAVCSRSFFWTHPQPGINNLVEIKNG
jgi:GT2 family glycosyltransferase